MDFVRQAAVGDELKRAARIEGISWACISRRIGIPYPRLLRLLNGQRIAQPSELRRIAHLLRVRPKGLAS